MWTRVELKQRAKEALKRNYWKIVLVAFVLLIVTGDVNGSNSRVNARKKDIEQFQETIQDSIESGKVDFDVTMFNHDVSEMTDDFVEGFMDGLDADSFDGSLGAIVLIVVLITLIVVAVVVVVVFLIDAFLLNPLYVGGERFMLKSVDDKGELSELAYAFDHSYMNIVKTMFMQDLFIFLWSLLLIIPGIIKKYQYRMVVYIMAENPDMDYRDALQMSKEMMDGQKWNAFVLDLSFILWTILGVITFGVVEILFVAPYRQLTNAALYRKLTGNFDNVQQIPAQDMTF